jgi:hypothetical protein
MTDTPKPKRPPTERLTPAHRAMHDPAFSALVTMLESYLHTAEFTPTELREAVMLAAIRYESRRVPKHVTVFSGVAVPHGEDRYGGPPPVLVIDGVPYRHDPGALSGETSERERVAERQFVDTAIRYGDQEPDDEFWAQVGSPKKDGA